jgi:predicted nucleotide-binding protein
MPRRSTPRVPERPVLNVDQLQRRIEQLNRCISDLEGFDPDKVQKRYDVPEVIQLEAAIDAALSAAFGHETPDYNRYSDAARLDHGPHTVRHEPAWGRGGAANYDAQDAVEARQYFAEGKQRSIALLRQAITALGYEIADRAPTISHPVEPSQQRDLTKVFIVHGHDDGTRETVARFIDKLGFDPIILHERPNKGRTIITKFREESAGVGFAIVLMTPDDMGCATPFASEKLQSRARQNVVFELGFFIGALRPEHVAALVKGKIERPSDFDGVVYISLDEGNWRTDLARELEAAGYLIDWNKVMR